MEACSVLAGQHAKERLRQYTAQGSYTSFSKSTLLMLNYPSKNCSIIYSQYHMWQDMFTIQKLNSNEFVQRVEACITAALVFARFLDHIEECSDTTLIFSKAPYP